MLPSNWVPVQKVFFFWVENPSSKYMQWKVPRTSAAENLKEKFADFLWQSRKSNFYFFYLQHYLAHHEKLFSPLNKYYNFALGCSHNIPIVLFDRNYYKWELVEFFIKICKTECLPLWLEFSKVKQQNFT